jgi:hypothetical protein
MSRRARLFSEFLDGSDVGQCVVLSATSFVSSLASRTTASTVSSVTQGAYLSAFTPKLNWCEFSLDVLAKRRKTVGLNSRFDRMVETMNINRPPVKGARNRARSTSSTSGSSVPKTPIDDYDEFHRDARLGTDFSVIKMGKSMPRNKKTKKLGGVFPWEQDSSSSDTTEVLAGSLQLPFVL